MNKKLLNVILQITTIFVLCNSATATVIYDDGGEHIIDFTINDDVEVRNSFTDDPTKIHLVENGEIGDGLFSTDDCEMIISGGHINDSIYADDNSIVNIYGGTIGYMIFANHYSSIYIYGYDFQIDGLPVYYGELDVSGGRLRGTLFSGDYIDNNLDICSTASVVLVPGPSTTYYVDAVDGNDNNNGLSKEAAFATIQKAIDTAYDGDTIVIAPGIYFENIYIGGKNIRLTSTDPNDPNTVAATIINGSQAANPNFGSVVRFKGTEDSNCILSGFTITGGTGTLGGYNKYWGGGICGTEYPDSHSSMAHRDIINTQAIIKNCVVTSNSVDRYGGGIAFSDGSILNSLISDNTASMGGGIAYSDGDITNCRIISNITEHTHGFGGGLYNCNGTIQYCEIAGNTAHRGGGLQGCDGKIHACTIVNNKRTGGFGFAGGLSDCDGEIISCLIAGNSSWGLSFSRGSVINCTIVRNEKGISCNIISNCIIWGNTEAQLGSSAVPLYSCVQGGSNGTGCIDTDPLFVDPDNGDYRLQLTSPCIDKAKYSYCMSLPCTDRNGNCRMTNGRVDMGCYEYDSVPDSDGDWLLDNKDVAPNDGDRDADGILDGIELLRTSNPDVFTPLTAWEVPTDVDTIQEAVFFSRDGEHITVLPGIYPENIRIVDRSVVLKSVAPNNTDVVSYTIINADTDADANTSNGRVVTFDTSRNPCKLLGLTLTGGNTPEYGGGVCGGGSSILIESCVIKGNTAGNGGGIALYRGQLKKCIISENRAIAYDGGGLTDCTGDITACVISGNCANRFGGGLNYCDGTIENCTIVYNRAKDGGGASSCPGKFISCEIIGNEATQQGGGLAGCGGGFYSGSSGEFSVVGEIKNCVVAGNRALYGGGLANCSMNRHRLSNGIMNCTIIGNIAHEIGGGYWANSWWQEYTVLKNCILWGNHATEGKEMGLGEPDGGISTFPTVDASYSNVQGGEVAVYVYPKCTLNWGLGNIDTDPCLVQPGYWDANDTPDDANDDFWVEGDYHLLPTSPCIDAGDPNFVAEPNETDLDGNPRVIGDYIDMGAYEYVPPVEAAMQLMPQMLNCRSKGKWIKAHFVLPEGFPSEDVDVNEPAVAEPMGAESEYIRVFGSDDGPVKLEVAFDRQAFCDLLTDEDSLEITVIGYLKTGQYFYGTDTIRIKTRRLRPSLKAFPGARVAR